jgi:DUF1009 family protein
MNAPVPESLILIAGQGIYPALLAASARRQGVRRLVVAAFRGETDPAIRAHADEVHWLRLGQLAELLDVLRKTGVRHAVMAGQITPATLFRVRPDARMFALLGRLQERHAHSIFGAIAADLGKQGIELLPACLFMESAMPEPGILGARAPDERERRDMAIGLRIAKTISGLDIGQTVAVKEGVVLAVEAFEGTDRTIRRAAQLGGPGIVVVKVAKTGHDMRFDIPVVGDQTLKGLKKARASALAVEARRTILLGRDALIRAADRMGLSLVALDAGA